MMLWRHATIFSLIVAVFVIAIYDTIAAWRGGYDSTITDVIRDASDANPIIPLIVGIVAGHLFGGVAVYFILGFVGGGILWNPAGLKLIRYKADPRPPIG
jgi:hypothetical protein